MFRTQATGQSPLASVDTAATMATSWLLPGSTRASGSPRSSRHTSSRTNVTDGWKKERRSLLVAFVGAACGSSRTIRSGEIRTCYEGARHVPLNSPTDAVDSVSVKATQLPNCLAERHRQGGQCGKGDAPGGGWWGRRYSNPFDAFL